MSETLSLNTWRRNDSIDYSKLRKSEKARQKILDIALAILFPILFKVAVGADIDPIQFAIIAVLILMIGFTTRPVGGCLHITSSIGGISLEAISMAPLPFLGVSLLVLLLVTYIPAISFFPPNLLFN
jgi:TRAP-type C4-dicarboxylate transport system permease large subunit